MIWCHDLFILALPRSTMLPKPKFQRSTLVCIWSLDEHNCGYIAYHVCLSRLLNVVSCDDDGGLVRGDQLEQVVPNPRQISITSPRYTIVTQLQGMWGSTRVYRQ